MSPSLPFLPLAPRCGCCKKIEKLMRCVRCKVMLYCSAEYQKVDFSDHKRACSLVAKKQRLLDHEEEKLRAEPGDGFATPANPFENSIGHFWGILATRDYMRARFGLMHWKTSTLMTLSKNRWNTPPRFLMLSARICRAGLLPARIKPCSKDTITVRKFAS